MYGRIKIVLISSILVSLFKFGTFSPSHLNYATVHDMHGVTPRKMRTRLSEAQSHARMMD